MAFYVSRGLRLHYEVVGDGAPVVLVHGITNHCLLWAQQLGPLVTSDRRAVLVDLAGHGRSAPVAGKTTVEELAADVVGVLDQLGLDRVALCGLSLGGAVVLQLLLNYPARVESAVLVATTAVIGPDAKPIIEEQQALFRSPGGPVRRLEEVWPLMVSEAFAGSAAGKAYYESWRQTLAAVDGDSLAMVAEGLLSFDVRDRLPEIGHPVLVIGGQDDLLASPGIVGGVAAAIPGARLELINRARHLPPLERPDIFNRLLLDFLDR